MSLRAFWNSLKEGIKGMIRHPLVMIASITTILLMLIIVSVFVIFSADSRFIMENIKKRPPVEVYLKLGATQDDVTPLIDYLDSQRGTLVEEYEVFTPEMYFQEFITGLGENSGVLDDFDYNLYVHYVIRIRLVDPSMLEEVELSLNSFPVIERIRKEAQVMMTLSRITRYVNMGTIIAFAILMIISLFIISNMVRISVYARSEEISIMKYVGATSGYIRLPYILEGVVTGLISAVCAWGVANFMYSRFYETVQQANLGGVFVILPPAALSGMVLVVCTVTGVLVGAFGSAISVRRYVQV